MFIIIEIALWWKEGKPKVHINNLLSIIIKENVFNKLFLQQSNTFDQTT